MIFVLGNRIKQVIWVWQIVDSEWLMFIIAKGFRSRLPVFPGQVSSFTVCLPADPTSHTTSLPVARGRTGLARALSSGRLYLLSQNRPLACPLSLPLGPEGSAPWTCHCPGPTDQLWPCPWRRPLALAEQQAPRDGAPGARDTFCFGEGRICSQGPEPGMAHPEFKP